MQTHFYVFNLVVLKYSSCFEIIKLLFGKVHMAKRYEHLVLLMEDIDRIICNVVFECLVLTIYGNSSISSTSLSKSMAFSYLHVDVIDIVGTTIIIINIKKGLIKTHVEFTKKVFFYDSKVFLWQPKQIMTKEILIGQLNFPRP